MSSVISINLRPTPLLHSSLLETKTHTCSASRVSFPCCGSKLRHGLICARAVGGESRDDSLDHLQRERASKRQQQQLNKQQQSSNRWVAPAAPIGLWDRFPTAKTIQQMMETMERIMEDPFVYNGRQVSSLPGEDTVGSYRRGRTPWDIKVADGEYRMRFDMPGMTKEDLKLWVEENMLVIKAEKSAKKDGEEGAVAEEEGGWPAKSYGRYNSRIALPENVVVEKIKAEVKDGVLYITIPRASASSKIMDIDVQ